MSDSEQNQISDNAGVNTALRHLREIQIELAEESAATRSRYLRQALKELLNRTAPEWQEPLLEKVNSHLNLSAHDDEPDPVEDERSTAFEQIKQLLPELSNDQKHELVALVYKSYGFAGVLRHEELVGQFGDLLEAMENAVLKSWQQLATKDSKLQCDPAMHKILQYLQEPNADDFANYEMFQAFMQEQFEKLKTITHAMIASITWASHETAKEIHQRFSPADIRDSIGVKGKSKLTSWDVACWREFEKLTDDELRIERIESLFQDNVVKRTEDLLALSKIWNPDKGTQTS